MDERLTIVVQALLVCAKGIQLSEVRLKHGVALCLEKLPQER